MGKIMFKGQEYTGTGIQSVVQTVTSEESGGINEIAVTLTDKAKSVFQVKNGVNANITAVSATIDENVGTPGVTVDVGGTPLNRELIFHFTNMKGIQGDPGVTFDLQGTVLNISTKTGG